MAAALWFIGATLGGLLGWWLGHFVGTVTAFVLSTLGTGAGVYWARRIMADYF
jgi:membrane protein YqaA with SNARE-associated domain